MDYSFLFQQTFRTAKTNISSRFPLSQLNSSSIQSQLKAAGIDTNSKQYQAVMQSMFSSCQGTGYTNIQAIKNRMSRYDKDGDYISPFTGLAGLVVTEKNRGEKGIGNGNTTLRSDVYLNLYQKMNKKDRLAAGNTLRQYEQIYTQAFVDAVKAIDPKWKPGSPIPTGALDGITRESVNNSRKSLDLKV